MLRSLLFLLALLLAPAVGQARGIDPVLVAEGPAPPGGEVELAIHMRTRPGWHGYWLNPGDAGLPVKVDWKLPEGASVGALRYPVPERLTIAGLMNYVYAKLGVRLPRSAAEQAAAYLDQLTHDQRIWEHSVVGAPPEETAVGMVSNRIAIRSSTIRMRRLGFTRWTAFGMLDRAGCGTRRNLAGPVDAGIGHLPMPAARRDDACSRPAGAP